MKDSRFLPARSLAERLVSPLPSGCPGLFNPWADTCPDDLEGNGPEEKLDRLGAHLACDPLSIEKRERESHYRHVNKQKLRECRQEVTEFTM